MGALDDKDRLPLLTRRTTPHIRRPLGQGVFPIVRLKTSSGHDPGWRSDPLVYPPYRPTIWGGCGICAVRVFDP